MSTKGKNQTFSREINNELVLSILRERPCSGTELASRLSLSNATVSSIIKDLLEQGVIRQETTTSINGIGRKRINFEINPEFGLILGVNISNLHATVSLINAKEDVIAESDLLVKKYNRQAMYELVLEASKLLLHKNEKNIPLKVIVITLPGRVNSKTGDLSLSIQFEKELFTEEHVIQHIFDKQFPGIPVLLANDNNVMSIGEVNNGGLKNCQNGLYFNIDFGIGGGIILDNSVYEGDVGYAGEFGLIKYFDGKHFLPIDEFVSLRALAEKASSILGHEVDREELFEQYKRNESIKNLVLESAEIVGKSLVQLTEILDISKVIISGRVENFGEEYLKIVKKNCDSKVRELDVSYSKLGNKAVIYGTSSIGVKYIFDLVKSRK